MWPGATTLNRTELKTFLPLQKRLSGCPWDKLSSYKNTKLGCFYHVPQQARPCTDGPTTLLLLPSHPLLLLPLGSWCCKQLTPCSSSDAPANSLPQGLGAGWPLCLEHSFPVYFVTHLLPPLLRPLPRPSCTPWLCYVPCDTGHVPLHNPWTVAPCWKGRFQALPSIPKNGGTWQTLGKCLC